MSERTTRKTGKRLRESRRESTREEKVSAAENGRLDPVAVVSEEISSGIEAALPTPFEDMMKRISEAIEGGNIEGAMKELEMSLNREQVHLKPISGEMSEEAAPCSGEGKKQTEDWLKRLMYRIITVMTDGIETTIDSNLFHSPKFLEYFDSVLTKFFGPLRESYPHLRNEVENLLKALFEYYDDYTLLHMIQVGELLQEFARLRGVTDKKELALIGIGGLLHDIGKPESIPRGVVKSLENPTFSGDIELHPGESRKMLEAFLRKSGIDEDSDEWKMILDIAADHHSYWARSPINPRRQGYGSGKTGQAVPELAREAAVVDAMDAATAFERSYKRRITFDDICDEMYAESSLSADVISGLSPEIEKAAPEKKILLEKMLRVLEGKSGEEFSGEEVREFMIAHFDEISSFITFSPPFTLEDLRTGPVDQNAEIIQKAIREIIAIEAKNPEGRPKLPSSLKGFSLILSGIQWDPNIGIFFGKGSFLRTKFRSIWQRQEDTRIEITAPNRDYVRTLKDSIVRDFRQISVLEIRRRGEEIIRYFDMTQKTLMEFLTSLGTRLRFPEVRNAMRSIQEERAAVIDEMLEFVGRIESDQSADEEIQSKAEALAEVFGSDVA